MAKPRAYALDNERDFKDLQAMIRRERSSPRVGAQRRRQTPIMDEEGGSSGGGGGLWVMSFVEFAAGCGCRAAWCLILRTPCGDNRWLPGDLVVVFDDLECVLNDTEDRLVGVKVIATRTEGDAYTASSFGAECQPNGYEASEPGECHFTFVRRCCLEPL